MLSKYNLLILQFVTVPEGRELTITIVPFYRCENCSVRCSDQHESVSQSQNRMMCKWDRWSRSAAYNLLWGSFFISFPSDCITTWEALALHPGTTRETSSCPSEGQSKEENPWTQSGQSLCLVPHCVPTSTPYTPRPRNSELGLALVNSGQVKE